MRKRRRMKKNKGSTIITMLGNTCHGARTIELGIILTMLLWNLVYAKYCIGVARRRYKLM